MDYNMQGSRDVIAINTSNGVAASFQPTGASIGNTLTAATFVLPLGSGVYAAMPGEATCLTAHLSWAAAVAGTITVECSNFPRYWNGGRSGPDDVTDHSTTTGHWIQWNPATAVPHIVQVTGTGNSATAYTITAGGTNAGGALVSLPDCGFRRVRLKIVASAGGLLRCCVTGKLGS